MTLLLVIGILAAEAVRCIRRRTVGVSRFGVLMLVLSACLLASDALAPAVQAASDWAKGRLPGLGGWASRQAGPGSAREAKGGEPDEAGSGMPTRARMGRLDLRSSYSFAGAHRAEAYLVFEADDSRIASYRDRLYLRTFAFDTFDGRGWTNTVPVGSVVVRDEEDGAADGWTVLEPGGADPLRYRVCLLAWHSALLPHVPTLGAVGLPEVVRYGNGLVAGPTGFPVPYLAYSALSFPRRWNPARDAALPMANPGSEYCSLPEGALASVISELALSVVGDDNPSRGEVAGRLMEHLRNRCRYSREVRNPERRDPLENFLLYEKAGHCELFATSYALLLRAAGIPARVAVGYCGGEYDAGRHVLTYTSDDAHAWTEIFLRDGGWTIADATPPDSAVAPGAPRPGRAPAAFDPERFAELGGLIAGARKEAAAAEARKGRGWGSGAPVEWSWQVGLGLLAVALAILVASRLRTRVRTGGSRPKAAAQEVSSFLRFFLRYFAREGFPMRPGRTLREYVAELKERGRIGDDYDDLVDYVYAISYGGTPRSSEREKQMTRWLKHVLK